MNASTSSPKAPPTTLRCNYCNLNSLRRSRLRATDLPWLLVLHWPLRCRRCSKRQFVFLTGARRIIAAGKAHTPEQLAQDSSQNFTANESPALRTDKHDEGKR